MSLTYDETVFYIELFGELDIATARELELVLVRAEGTDAKEICVDLSGLEFMDSMGVSCLIKAGTRSSCHGDRLRLLRGTGQVDRVLVLCGLEDQLPFAD